MSLLGPIAADSVYRDTSATGESCRQSSSPSVGQPTETCSASQPIRKFREPGDRDVHRFAGRRFAAALAALVGPRHMGGAQATGRRVDEVVGVRRDHHAGARRQVERCRGREVDPRLGLVVTGDLGAQDRVPRQVVAAGEIDHEGDVCRSTPAPAGSAA